MAGLSELKVLLEEYERKYRHPSLLPLEVSGLYDLFPRLDSLPEVQHRWPDVWPHSERRGVYVILDKNLEVRYVGKASMASCLGSRLGQYFGYVQDRSCKIHHPGWGRPPRYVVTVAMPNACSFEAPALEEFLIDRLRPPDNSVGVKDRSRVEPGMVPK